MRPLGVAGGGRRGPAGRRRTGRVRLGGRQLHLAGGPELVEVGDLDADGASRSRQVVEVAQPGGLVAALGERLADAEAVGQVGEDVVVVARLADRLPRPPAWR